MRAVLKNYRQSPRKVRLVADAIRGHAVSDALIELRYLDKRATEAIGKVLKSALANAVENDGKEEADLFIKRIAVDEGVTLRRFRPRARGRATRINKRTSHITIELGDRDKQQSSEEVKKSDKEAPKVAAK